MSLLLQGVLICALFIGGFLIAAYGLGAHNPEPPQVSAIVRER